MTTTAAFDAIAQLDLEPIKTKLMHVASGEGWSRAKVDAMDTEYRRFLYLMHCFPNEETAPTVDVDTFWHYHILDTMKYAADCQHVYGHFLHHHPYLGMGADDAGAEQRGAERMRELYEATFGEPYLSGAAAAYCMIRPGERQAEGAQAAYCMIRPGDKGDKQAAAAQAAAAQAAYCMIKPGAQQTKGAQAAYCMIRPGASQDDGAQAAYCMIRPGQAASGSASRT